VEHELRKYMGVILISLTVADAGGQQSRNEPQTLLNIAPNYWPVIKFILPHMKSLYKRYTAAFLCAEHCVHWNQQYELITSKLSTNPTNQGTRSLPLYSLHHINVMGAVKSHFGAHNGW